MAKRDTAPMFSRSGDSNPLGKNTAEIKVLVPDDLREKIGALAVLRSTTVSEYVRELLMAHVYGQIEVIKLKSEGRNRE